MLLSSFSQSNHICECLLVKNVVYLHIDFGIRSVARKIRSVARKSEDAVDLQSDLDTTEHHIRDRATNYPYVLDWSIRW